MTLSNSITEPQASDLDLVREIADRLGLPLWVVGGPVRDALLGRPLRDLDFLVEERLDELAAAVADETRGRIEAHDEFMTATLRLPSGRSLDFTTARKEVYERPGALPIVRPAPVDADLHRRDFSVNAIAWNARTEKIVDPLGGREDIERRLIRILHDRSFLDDPTRIFRAGRFATRLRFDIESRTEQLLRTALDSGALETISTQRLMREFRHCLGEERSAEVLSALVARGVFSAWLGAKGDTSILEARLPFARELIGRGDEIDEEILYLGLILRGMAIRSQPDLGFSRPRVSLLRSLTLESGVRSETWISLHDDQTRAGFCLDHEPEEVIAAAVELPDDLAARQMVDFCRRIRNTQLPFGGDDLEVPPGPHIGSALREATIRAALEDPPRDELLSFARQVALRYLSFRNETHD
ncbi:MAG: hypothetical protein R3338_06695 [Thermoanaerobaculia bacterium]|nr:hypothetical protein [Thermoanaerobaculia bacterium]